MTITFGNTKDLPNVIGKEITWDTPLDNIVTRDTINVRMPVIILNGYDVNPAKNYARVLWDGEQDFRYYFVSTIEKLTGNCTRVSLRVDVLETYKTYIGTLSVVAERASSFANRYIADGAQRTSAKPQIIFKQFNGATPFISDGITAATRCIVVRAIAKEVTK